jgi:hypothetical protein
MKLTALVRIKYVTLVLYHEVTDLDECSSNNGGCEQHCHNTNGSCHCSCNSEYIINSDGHHCDDIPICSINNGECSQYCVKTVGSYKCYCSVNGNGDNCTGKSSTLQFTMLCRCNDEP